MSPAWQEQFQAQTTAATGEMSGVSTGNRFTSAASGPQTPDGASLRIEGKASKGHETSELVEEALRPEDPASVPSSCDVWLRCWAILGGVFDQEVGDQCDPSFGTPGISKGTTGVGWCPDPVGDVWVQCHHQCQAEATTASESYSLIDDADDDRCTIALCHR